jgi:hypothetical protein
MELRIKNPQSRNVLILVHGLNGSLESWEGSPQHFVENLRTASVIQQFDVYLFQYPTKIFELTGFKRIRHTVQRFLWNKPHEDLAGFNNGIDSISKVLESEMRDISVHYDTISFIAHSMGGLVVKSAICWTTPVVREKIRLVISLSVPHLGANLATVRKLLFGKHPQLIDLVGMGEFTTNLNRRYADVIPKPRMYYQNGGQDTIVCEAAAIPGPVTMNDTTTTPDNHFSVLLIRDPNQNHLFRTILRELNEATQPDQGNEKSTTQLGELQQYAALVEEFDRIQVEDIQEQVRKKNDVGGRMGEFIVQRGIPKADIATKYSETNLVGLLFAIVIAPQAEDRQLLLDISNRIRLSYSKWKFIESLAALEGRNLVPAQDRSTFATILKAFLPDPSTNLPRRVGQAMTSLAEMGSIGSYTVLNKKLLINHNLRVSDGNPRWGYLDDPYYEKVFHIEGSTKDAVDCTIDPNGQIISEVEYTFVKFKDLIIYAEILIREGSSSSISFWLALKTNIVEAKQISAKEWEVPVRATTDLGDWRRAIVGLSEAFEKTEMATKFSYVNLRSVRFRASGKIGAVFVR